MEPTNGSFVPTSSDLAWVVFIQQVLALIAWLINTVIRQVLENRITVPTASATLAGLVGLWGGLVITGWIFDSGGLWKPGMTGAAVLVTFVVAVVISLIAAYLHPHPGLDPISEVTKHDESDSLKFKSSARRNIYMGERDDAMETVVVKTVAASVNSGGDTLLIGVDGDGRLIGTGPDYSTLRTLDSDRLELWI